MIPNSRIYRILEIIPGFWVWLTFILAIVLSFFKPTWVIYFIIIFDLYWLLRVTYFVFYLMLSWQHYEEDIKIDWLDKLRKTQNLPWQNIYHLIFLPTYQEGLPVLRTTFQSLVEVKYPLDKMMIVLAGEERNKENFLKNAEIIKQEFSNKFFKLLITLHPSNLPNEIKGKGANAHWAGKEAKKMVDRLLIPYQNIIVSYFDIDTCVHPQYFAYLTYKYLTHPSPHKTSFQPVALYNNNIWLSPALTRIAAFGTTFWLMTELARPERLFTFSSHSMSWQALVDVGFWQKDIITDDSRIFLQCLVHYQGDYTVTPMYIPVSMDTVSGKNWFLSLINLYKQQRRWAWGIEHFPYMVKNFFLLKNTIPLKKKIKYLWNLGEGMYSWATAPVLIFILGRLPLKLAPPEVVETALFQNAPFILEWLMFLAMIGILLSAILSLMLLPPRPKKIKFYKFLVMILQWIFLPITLVIFGSLPAIEAQTRLMLGKYLGFFNTPKVRS